MFRTLQKKTFLITSVTIFIFVGLFLIAEYNKDKKYLYERQVIRMKENSFTIRNSLESIRIPLLFQSILEAYARDILNYEETPGGIKDDPFAIPPHEIHIVNADSIVMASTRPELIGIPLAEAIQHEEEGLSDVLTGKASYTIEQIEHSGVKVLDMSVPVRDNGTIIGALHYVEPYIKLEALVQESFVRHLIFALVMILSLTVFINLLLTKMVTKPIKDLSHAMDRISIRGASEEISLSSGDEIGLLAQSFNDMSQALQQRDQEVKKYTVKLEEMVDERTKELRESQDQLIQTEKLASMGTLAGYIAHEINNPTGIIVSRAECMLMDSQEKGYPETLVKDIKVIKKHSNRIATITKGMLTFSRKSPAEFGDVDINAVIDETLQLFEKQFLLSDITIHKQVDCELSTMTGNATQLQQVFFNIFNNALDVLPQGGDIKIQTHCGSDGMAHITIADNGPGIAREQVDKIFDPFYTTKSEGKGTGLGLSVTYGIIKDHHGQITVQSQIDEGTIFEILLPLKDSTGKV